MGVVNVEEITGYQLRNGEVVCTEHITEEEEQEATESEILTEQETSGDDHIYFCDRCKKRL